ncbi:MAG: hypothetical protein FWC50_04320 [Planctomycetaceae bacterium]|nr:hypothetical protein [Planctomycetaceae bacterium]
MTESTQTHEFLLDGNAAAKCRVVGLALMVVGVCWFFRFLPYFIVRLYFPLENDFSLTEFIIKSVILFAGTGIFACSYYVLKRRCYWLALLAPLICLSLFAFSCSIFFINLRRDWHGEYAYYDDLYESCSYPWYHPMEGMIPTEQVESIASCFADYTPRHYLDVRHHPKVEIPVNMTLFFLAPTTLIGLFGLCTLLTPRVRRSFSVPLAKRVKMSAAGEKTQDDYCRGLSRAYSVLMFLLLLAILPTIIMDFWKPDRYDYLMPPVNVSLNYAIVGCMMIGVVSYFTRRYYVFALLAPLAWLASVSYFRWQIAWDYMRMMDSSYPYVDSTRSFYSMILIVLVSRLVLSGLGIWIWWKNRKFPGSTHTVTDMGDSLRSSLK